MRNLQANWFLLKFLSIFKNVIQIIDCVIEIESIYEYGNTAILLFHIPKNETAPEGAAIRRP